jgi:ribosomal protein S18 acetylase RimI-like enzyme
MLYREANPADLPSICALGEEVNSIHHVAWPEIFAGPGAPERDLAHWSQSVAADDAKTFVAEENARVVGFVNVSVTTETHSLLQPMRYARIGSVSVTANRRGCGIGSRLMALAEQWATQQGAQEMRLNVWAFNQAALNLYAELGYDVRSHLLGKRLAATNTDACVAATGGPR